MGRAVLDALSASRTDIPDPGPADFKSIQERLLRFLGVRRWGEVARNFRSVSVESERSTVRVTHQRVGEAASFIPDGEPVCCPRGDVEGIGRGVLLALKVKDA